MATTNARNNLPVFFKGADNTARRLGAHLQSLALTCCPPLCPFKTSSALDDTLPFWPWNGASDHNATTTTRAPSTSEVTVDAAQTTRTGWEWTGLVLVAFLVLALVIGSLVVIHRKKKMIWQSMRQSLHELRLRKAALAAKAATRRNTPKTASPSQAPPPWEEIELQPMGGSHSSARSFYSSRSLRSEDGQVSMITESSTL